jgi:hypothetical protein
VGYVARKLGGHKFKSIAEHFNRDPVVISQGIKRTESKLKEVKGFGEKITRIEKSLTAKSSRKKLS